MLQIWLENKHSEVWKEYEEFYFSDGMPKELKAWLEVFHIDLYRQYVEEVIKPTEVLKALLCGLTISVESQWYMLNDQDQFCQIVPTRKPYSEDYGENLVPVLDFVKIFRKVRTSKRRV